ncbi:MAG: hypothetical protein A2W22_06425 [Candidatus Levybacteria bacterium RBG_16_35_11]|nr:MAG: hypothetical protein A2W22_06425 [Candidatus Levybacteria bacterium RBG_16_35_11]
MVSDIKPVNKRRTSDKRKVALISIASLAVIIFLILGSTSANNNKTNQSPKKGVKSSTAKSIIPVNEIKSAVEDKIGVIQEEAKDIDLAEVASSSPQIQKIIKDLKSLENYPADQAKSLCEKICSGL